MTSPWRCTLETPIGRLVLSGDDRALNGVAWVEGAEGHSESCRHPLAERACTRLSAWFADPRTPLDLPLAPSGTPYQQRAWSLLRTIPAGQRHTYGELAERLGSAPRAVGGACAANPLLLLIPCHRVVARQGLGGFSAGVGREGSLALKRWLLDHESSLRS
ncbi:methylated-DNA--[protein]-cysteine S-methyltransferase [Alkalilimnicola ehrlichii]|uniref:methylated-DNA--[protein]-cysteine S-methyltransferase n=1 Tax=Alkalilimnicola ehrlichii TaxID=351052 RepID=UPI003BA33BD8